MNIDTEVNVYLSRLTTGEKVLLLELLKKFNDTGFSFSATEKIFAYNNELEKGVQKIENGDYLKHEDILKESDGW